MQVRMLHAADAQPEQYFPERCLARNSSDLKLSSKSSEPPRVRAELNV